MTRETGYKMTFMFAFKEINLQSNFLLTQNEKPS